MLRGKEIEMFIYHQNYKRRGESRHIIIRLLSINNYMSFSMLLLTVPVPLVDNFLVLMILAANSSPVDFCTHRRTILNAPLKY